MPSIKSKSTKKLAKQAKTTERKSHALDVAVLIYDIYKQKVKS